MMQIPDPVHGYIELDGMFADIVNTPEFQRLRSVEQGSFRPVYPGARHDRFAHSLGTYHLAKKFAEPFFRNLANDVGVVLPAQEQEMLTRTFLYAALLHDVGHAPFSHTTEGFFAEKKGNLGLPVIWEKLCDAVNKENSNEGTLFYARNKMCGAPHEVMSATVMVEKWKNFHPHRNTAVPDVDLALAARMVIGFTYSPKDLDTLTDQDVVTLGVRNCLIQMINYSLLDVDRLDYMGRDKLMSGFVNATLDLECLSQSATAVGQPDAWVLWKMGGTPRPTDHKDQVVLKVREKVGATLLKNQEIVLPAATGLVNANGSATVPPQGGRYTILQDVPGLELKEGVSVTLVETGGVALCNQKKMLLPKGTVVEDRQQQGSRWELAADVKVELSADTRVQPNDWVLWKDLMRPCLKDAPTLCVQKKVGATLVKNQKIQLPQDTVLVDANKTSVVLDKDSGFNLCQDIPDLAIKQGEWVALTRTGSVVLRKEIKVRLPKGTEFACADGSGKMFKLARAWFVVLKPGTLMRPDDVVDVKLVKDAVELMPDGTEKAFKSNNRLQLRPTWLVPGYRDAALRVFDLMFQAKLSHDAWVLAAPAGAYDAALLAHCIRQLDGKILDSTAPEKYMKTIFTADALSRDGIVFAGKHYRLLSDVDVAADLKAQTGDPFDELYTRELEKRRIAAWRSYYEYHHIFNCPEMGLSPESVYEFFKPLMEHMDEQKFFIFDEKVYQEVAKSNDAGAIRAAVLLREFLRNAHSERKPDEEYNVVLLDRTSNFTMKLDPADIRIVFADHTRESKKTPLRSGRYNYSTYGEMTGITAEDKRAKPYFYIMRHNGLGRVQLERLRNMLVEELNK